MQTPRYADERGSADFGWLQTHHTFSFGQYLDPAHMGFGVLRVINDDRIQPAMGFGTHPHRDMEIITYVLDGALEHRDSLGTGSVIRAGDVQRMTAGTGVTHSEYNHSDQEPVHLLQIWILPEAAALEPGYEQRHFAAADKHNRLRLIASRDGRESSVTVHQDVSVYAAQLEPGAAVTYQLDRDRMAWLQVARGSVVANDLSLAAGDGLALAGEPVLRLRGQAPCELLLFDMAAAEPA
ncbi:MAG: pirin family protein [Gammaproteobacteria bacterium]|jgi:redox-sensitive bicupin YhaK (pirin superfamily)|nr:pirin family protein [Gammaproteobacteria bacterium]